ncbi:MAG TPA: adenosylmethionine--8-amino-7-oxononanoate transaminase [Nitrospirae bacterium]|nr:adenosylmethionine--8-amino-7-oxononanoate transaminase [Nitrospirota bacterium]HDO22193.1 adenosylmethionine--8-amino-7-oxononanoate transaminase [Nitrospirota bacterium]HDZ87337.1 adenosylmethionine--8-amino-7-oxononanoate transaminase [Nitrospirota bacterium]
MDIFEHINRLREDDRKYIWHPFTQMKEWVEEPPVIITEAKDCFIKDIKGTWYLDGVSSLWVNIHGHGRREINDAIKAQLDKVSHTTLLGLANVPSIELAKRLVDITPEGLSRVFYSDNGSTSVEVALKMAFQYWKHKGVKSRNTFIALNNAYHGDTLGAVSAGGVDIFHETFGPLLFRTFRAPSPYCYRCELKREPDSCKTACLEVMEEILKRHSDEIAGVILEPLVQAAGGMICAPGGYLKGVRDLCSRYDVLLILDEVATGFGRTGKMFACEHEDVVPDIICLSKGLTGGYLPLAATICTDEIHEAFLGEFREMKTFFHGHSYTGNQLGCVAGLACLDIFENDRTVEKLQPGIALFNKWLKEVEKLDHVGDARAWGMMGGVELVKDKDIKEEYPWEEKMGWQVVYKAREKGVFLRPLGNIIVIMPPLVISEENFNLMLEIISNAIQEIT